MYENEIVLNAAPLEPVVVQSETLVARRYSNADATGSDTGLGKDDSGSGIWGSITDIVNAISGTVTSIWGTNDKTRAEYINQLYAKEQQTTKILIGIIVALVLLAFVFLIIKKK